MAVTEKLFHQGIATADVIYERHFDEPYWRQKLDDDDLDDGPAMDCE